MRRSRVRISQILALAVAFVAVPLAAAAPSEKVSNQRPNILFITIDTLRADRLSAWGYRKPTSPNIDRLVNQGIRFTKARTVEPLTGPAMTSALTSRHPHQHGAVRNAVRVRRGLSSVSRILRRNGWTTAAFVSNWTLAAEPSGLDEHFEYYEEVLTSRRWLGLFKEEAKAEDVTEATVAWLGEWSENRKGPFFVWAHYTDPHAPYVFRREFADRLNIPLGLSRPPLGDRYDTEIAAADAAIGDLLDALEAIPGARNTLIVFTSDHGESFGEHGAWGHGRTLWEEAVRIPLAYTWPGRLRPGLIENDTSTVDLAPTILGLAAVEVPAAFVGYDWSAVLRGEARPPRLTTLMQSHRGAPLPGRDPGLEEGLIEVGVIRGSVKYVWRPDDEAVRAFNLAADPWEQKNLATEDAPPAPVLAKWHAQVTEGLRHRAGVPATLDRESVEKLRALGYLD